MASSDSAGVSVGRIPGRRAAIIDFPDPGGATYRFATPLLGRTAAAVWFRLVSGGAAMACELALAAAAFGVFLVLRVRNTGLAVPFAALAFLVIAIYLIGIGKPSIYVVVPGIFVLITTIAALCYQSYTLVTAPEPNYEPAAICVVLIVLAAYVSAEAVPRMRQVVAAARAYVTA